MPKTKKTETIDINALTSALTIIEKEAAKIRACLDLDEAKKADSKTEKAEEKAPMPTFEEGDKVWACIDGKPKKVTISEVPGKKVKLFSVEDADGEEHDVKEVFKTKKEASADSGDDDNGSAESHGGWERGDQCWIAYKGEVVKGTIYKLHNDDTVGVELEGVTKASGKPVHVRNMDPSDVFKTKKAAKAAMDDDSGDEPKKEKTSKKAEAKEKVSKKAKKKVSKKAKKVCGRCIHWESADGKTGECDNYAGLSFNDEEAETCDFFETE